MRAVALLVLLAGPAQAQTTAARLAEAQRRMVEGDYQGTLAITSPLVGAATLTRADLAEAMRLHGLTLFYLGRPADAEPFLHQFLRLDPEARLDPALVPPEAIAFFESIRSRYEGELRALKPKREAKGSVWLNAIPAYGQFQNKQPLKGWLFLAAEVVLLATNVSTYLILRSECADDLTCSLSRDSAHNLRLTNLISGGVLLGVYVLGVIDGVHVFRCREAPEEPPPFALVPHRDGATLMFSMGF